MDGEEALNDLFEPQADAREVTEGGETFRVEIPDAAFRAWLGQRARLGPGPLAERPPDRISGDYWVWLARDGEAIEAGDSLVWDAPDGAALALERAKRPAGVVFIETTTGADGSSSTLFYLLRAAKPAELLGKMRAPLADAGWTERPKPGFEEIPLDLSRVPTVEDGLRAAAERYKQFADLAKASLGPADDKVLLMAHLPLMSFINRATSLHAGVVSAVEKANPHAAFTLLRAYLELVVLVFYVDKEPDYLGALERPISELPPNTRKSFRELFAFASSELVGVQTVYALLNEMAHFGSTALWHPFSLDEEGERRMSFSTGPHWKKPDDPRTALAMLAEADEAVLVVLRRFAEHHVTPKVERYAREGPSPD
jgi:hypothetical protein